MDQLDSVMQFNLASMGLLFLAQARRIDDKTVYTIDQAAFLVQCHRDTLTRAITAKKLTAAKVGYDWRIRGEHLNRWLDSGGKTGRTKGRY